MLLVTGSADQKLIADWDARLRACQQARLRFERDWHFNMAFFFGRQWVRVVKSGSSFNLAEERPKDNWRVRHTANRILRIVRTELTKLTKEEPQFFCVPKSSEETDRLAAMAGETIAEWLLETKYFNRKRSLATFWAILCGTAYLKNSYSPNAIERDGLPGKMEFHAISPFHLFVPNLLTTEMEDQPYVQQAETMTPETVWNMFGVELEPGTNVAESFSDTRFLASLGVTGEVQENQKSQQCYIKEVYVMPCKTFPNGAMFIHGEGQILYISEELPEQSPIDVDSFEEETPVGTENTDLETDVGIGKSVDLSVPKSIHEGMEDYNHVYPYQHRRYPFAKIDHIPTGMWYAESVIKSLIPSQKEYNRTRSIMLEHRNYTSKPQWSYTAGAFDPRKFTGKPGLLLPVNMGFEPPKAIEQPELDNSVGAELDVVLRDMDDISSQFEVTKGRTPPGVEAASAIAYLSEENDSILHFTVTSIENAVQETGVQILSNVHEFWEEDRLVKMTSENQHLEIRAFKATDLNPLTDFRVVAGSMAPRSEAAKQAFIVDLMDRGLPLEKALKYLKMNETAKLYEDLMLDSNHAMRENVIMSQGNRLLKPIAGTLGMPDPMTGQPSMEPQYKTDVFKDAQGADVIDPKTGQPQTYQVTINPYDNHEVHIEEHQNFQKTQEYEMLSLEIKEIIQEHVDEHKAEILKERNALRVDDIQTEAGMNQATQQPEMEEAVV